jgi:hypothetical protein
MLEAGQVLHDNDPRYRGRKLEVIRVEGSYAVCKSGPRQVKVPLDYIFSDGMPRRSGLLGRTNKRQLTRLCYP